MRKYLTEWCKKIVKSGKLSQAAVPLPIEKNKNKSTLLSRFRSIAVACDGKERPV